ncbi:MAG: ATP-binding protein [Deltaproteobacteria bacterium]|nr:ATP-binding protein [Deltaproteobacteria bacterium]
MDQQISALLQKDNPWIGNPDALTPWLKEHLPLKYLGRNQLLEKQTRWTQQGKAHLLIGPRQAGKSTLIWQWIFANKREALFIDCEQPLIRSWCESAPQVAMDIKEGFSKVPILFFEEVQHLENAGLFFKGLVDRKPGAPILVTGSSSYHLRSQTRESLAGRATRARLLPFSLEEVSGELDSLAPLGRSKKQDELLERHMVFGGYPEVWLSSHPERILTDLLESFVIRDASDLYQIKRPDAFRTLLSLAARQVGSLVNVSEWAQILSVSRETVYSYLEILSSAHILELVRPFAGGKRSELTKSAKVFWIDLGLRNRLLANFQPLDQRQDRGPLLENWVYTEIIKSIPTLAEVFFWRSTSGAEVDFVIRNANQLAALEVKSAQSPRKKITRSMRSFIDAYQPKSFCVVHPGIQSQETIASTKIDWLPPAQVSTWLKHHVSG